MSKPFLAIVENGYQFLQSPDGERLNYITKTTITQTTDKVAKCIFSINVNYPGGLPSCQYDPKTMKLTTPSGEILDMEIADYSPETSKTVESLTVGCLVVFPYETKHKELTTNN